MGNFAELCAVEHQITRAEQVLRISFSQISLATIKIRI
jgi:hypothetical protein